MSDKISTLRLTAPKVDTLVHNPAENVIFPVPSEWDQNRIGSYGRFRSRPPCRSTHGGDIPFIRSESRGSILRLPLRKYSIMSDFSSFSSRMPTT